MIAKAPQSSGPEAAPQPKAGRGGFWSNRGEPSRRLALARAGVVVLLCLLGVLVLLAIAVYLDVIERRGLPDPFDIFIAIILANVVVIGGGLWFIRGIAWVRAGLYGPRDEPPEPGIDDYQPGLDRLLNEDGTVDDEAPENAWERRR